MCFDSFYSFVFFCLFEFCKQFATSKRNGIEQQQTAEVSIHCSNFEFHNSNKYNIPKEHGVRFNVAGDRI